MVYKLFRPTSKINNLFEVALDKCYRENSCPFFIERDDGDVKENTAKIFFERYQKFSQIEKEALQSVGCRKKMKILDVGAGGGRVGLYFQKKRADVTVLDKSMVACKIMKERGLKKIIRKNIFHFFPKNKFDVVIIFAQHIFAGKDLKGLAKLLKHIWRITSDRGELILTYFNPLFSKRTQDFKYYKENLSNDRYIGYARWRILFNNFMSPWYRSIYSLCPEDIFKTAYQQGWFIKKFKQSKNGYYFVILKK